MKLRIRFSDGLELNAQGVKRRLLSDRDLKESAGPWVTAQSFLGPPPSGVWEGWPGALAWEPETWRLGFTEDSADLTNESTGADWSLVERKPDSEGWRSFLGAALSDISAGRIQKVVAARSETYRCHNVSLEELEKRLFGGTGFEGTHRFLLDSPWGVFLGASPEYLYSWSEKKLLVPAIAGTCPRGQSPGEDARLKRDLLGDKKEELEHRLVKNEILENLTALGFSPEAAPTQVLTLSSLHHLHTKVEAVAERIAAADLVGALHPTPALGGWPRAEAMALLSAEPTDRGFFGGPIGFWTSTESRMVVGIRSALLRDKEATLFAGAGIVKGSTAEAEWNETHRKMKSMRDLLQIPEVRDGGL